MKKLMIMTVGLALMTGFAQAVAINWSSGAVLNPDTGIAVGATTGEYIAQIWFFTDALGASPFAAGGTLTDNSTASFGSALSGTTGNTFANAAPAGTYYAQMIITTSDGMWQMDSGIVALGVLPSSPANGTLNFSSGVGTQAGTPIFTGDWEAVPEPTSVALLAIGVAAIGLRRRFRK